MRLASFLLGGFTAIAVINSLENKLANRTSVCTALKTNELFGLSLGSGNWSVNKNVLVLLRLIKKVCQNESYPHMNLYVSDFSLTDSTLVVLDPSVNFAVMFEHFGK